jgi:hypothetical protein
MLVDLCIGRQAPQMCAVSPGPGQGRLCPWTMDSTYAILAVPSDEEASDGGDRPLHRR